MTDSFYNIKKIVLLPLIFLFSIVLFAQKKPNVVVVITDDQGFNDLGVMGILI